MQETLPDFAPSFYDPGLLTDSELSLHLVETYPGNTVVDWPPYYRFAMRLGNDRVTAGHITLRLGSSPELERYAGHIGYDVDPPYRGRHLAARSCRLLLPLARLHGLRPVWITCNPDNAASRRTCELAGASFVDIVELPLDHDMRRLLGERWKCRYRLDP